MSRTTIEVPMKTNKVDVVLGIISATLIGENYKQKIVDGETVWAKGDAFLGMQCFGATFTDHSVVIQAWMREALVGEYDLEGFVAMFPKKKMKRLLDRIRLSILSRNV